MSQETDRLRELYRAWNRGDPGWDYCTSDVEWDASHWAPDMPDVARGTEEAGHLIRRFMGTWTDVRFEPERFVERGSRVVVLVKVHARGRGSGVPFVDSTAHVFTLRDGLVAHFAHYRDTAEALAAVGLSE
jgi:ketosteroid isomerase-like protein